ncbi:hypothetical protein [Streptomyces sp. NPDC059874]
MKVCLRERLRKPEVRRLALTGVTWLLALVVAGFIAALTAKVVDTMW